MSPFRTEFQSEFQLKETDGKRIHQEFLKNWGKKVDRHMFSQKKIRISTNSFNQSDSFDGKIRSIYLTQLKSTNFEVKFARILEVLGSFQLVIYPNLFFQLRYLILKIIVTFWVIIIIGISGTMLAFSGRMNETECVRNRGVDSRHIRYSTSYSPCHKTSQNKSEKNTLIRNFKAVQNNF